MSHKPGFERPKIGDYPEFTHAGITLRAYHGFGEQTRKDAEEVCENIANLKDEVLKSLVWVNKMERKTKRALEVILYLTDPEDDMKRYREKKPENPVNGYNLNVHFVDTWKQRRNIFESYEISLHNMWGDVLDRPDPNAVYVQMRFTDSIYRR